MKFMRSERQIAVVLRFAAETKLEANKKCRQSAVGRLNRRPWGPVRSAGRENMSGLRGGL
jgi:hypothetical protein